MRIEVNVQTGEVTEFEDYPVVQPVEPTPVADTTPPAETPVEPAPTQGV